MAGKWKPKLVVFDINQTLIEEETWKDLNLAMGVTKEEDEMFMRWYEEGIITYEEGQKLLERIYRERSGGNKETAEEAVAKYTYRKGARELVEELKKKGYKVGLVSGSVSLLVEKVAEELGVEMAAAHNRLVFDEMGEFVGIVCDGDDADFKLAKLKEFCGELGVAVEEAACVGDGYNDRKIFAACGRGVTFKGSKVEDLAWKVVEGLEEVMAAVES